MKFLYCHTNFVPSMGPRFVYEGGPSENPFSETEGSKIEAAKKAETVTEYKSDTDKTYYDGIIKGKVDSKKTELEGMLDAKLAAIKDDDPNKDKLKSDIEAEKKKIPEKLKQYKKELETARDASLGKIKSAVEARNTEIKEEAKKYKQSIVLEMEAHEVEARQNHPNKEDEGNWDKMKDQVKNYGMDEDGIGSWNIQKSVAMQQFGEGAVDTKETKDWDRNMQIDMITEAIQTIYEEHGKEEADKMMQKIRDNKGDGKINWFTYNSAFRGSKYMKEGGEDSAFKFVHANMGAPVDKPKAFGHVLGKMYSADKYFSEKGAPNAFKEYQAYVQTQLKDYSYMKSIDEGSNEKDILSPAQWLKEQGSQDALKEVMANLEKDRKKFVEDIVAGIEVKVDGIEGDASRIPLIQSALEGAMWGSDDPKEWDRIAKGVLAKMMGGEFDRRKMNVINIDISRFIVDGSKEYGDSSIHQMIGSQGTAFVAGLIEGAEQKYGQKDPEFVKKYKEFIKKKFANDSDLMWKIRNQLGAFQSEGVVLQEDLAAQATMKQILDANIRAAYNYKSDLEKAQKKQEQKEEEKKPKVDEQLEKDKADTSKVLLVMTDHTASRTSPTQYRQAVSMKAAYEKAEDKKAWLDSNKEELDSLKKRMPKVLGWEKGLGIERKDSGEVEKDPTNAKPSQAPAGQPSGAPKEGGGDKGLEAFGKESIDVAKAEAAEKGDPLKKEDVPKKVQEKVKDQDPGFYSVTYKEDGVKKKVLVEVKNEKDKKKEDFFAPKKTV